jgi:predicted GH43/DUF377 family glycosyl hydrolase
MRSAICLIALLFVLSGCGNYADFTLPRLEPMSALPQLSWEMLPEPVLSRGPAGTWDAVDALNPSVVRRDGRFYNFYSGYDGATWHTGLAESTDGLQWEKLGPVLSPSAGSWEGDYIAANGAALDVDGEFLYWYQAGRTPRIGLARSRYGRTWSKCPEPVLDLGPRGSWDERGVADPYVIRVEGRFYMYYLGQDRARRQRLGVAVSDDGVEWSKLRGNPILELGAPRAFDEIGLGEPAVWIAHDRYWMLYTARDRKEHRRLGLAVSNDGVSWERISDSAVLEGDQDWNSKVVCDPTVEVDGDRIQVWFGGGDVAAPAENLNGEIGLAILHLHTGDLFAPPSSGVRNSP